MPTVRVRCLLEQMKVWSVRAEVTASHSGEDCLVAVACGLVDMIDLAKAQLTLVAVVCGLVCRGRAAGDAPVMWRCTRYVALHPLCGAAPEQKGCNAYSSGALPLGTSESVVGVCRGDCVAQRGGLPRHTEGSASRRVQLSVYPSFCLKGLIHDDVVVSGASGREAVEELRRSGALDALFERLDAGEVEMTGSQGLLPALLKEAWERGLAGRVQLSVYPSFV